MEDNVKNFLDKIQEIQNNTIEVDLISTGKKIKSTPLTFKQQKELISTIADGPVGALKFQRILNQIVLHNTGNSLVRSIDRLPIIIKLRAAAIGSTIALGDDKNIIVNIQDILEKITKSPKPELSYKIEGDIEISLEVPLMTKENAIVSTTIESVLKNVDNLGKNVGDIYTYEIVKYIKDIKFGEDVITFEDIYLADKVNIVDNLPISINKKIIEFIENIKKIENDWLTIEVDGDKVTLDMDITFFEA